MSDDLQVLAQRRRQWIAAVNGGDVDGYADDTELSREAPPEAA